MAEEIKITSQQLQSYFKALKDELAQDQRDQLGAIVIELETLKHIKETSASKADITAAQEKINQMFKDQKENIDSLLATATKNQPIIDNYLAKQSAAQRNGGEKMSFKDGWGAAIQEHIGIDQKTPEFQKMAKEFQSNQASRMNFKLDLKTMTIATTVTGDTVQSYNSRQGLAPAQAINFRDILDTTPSPDGSMVTYRETNAVQVPGVQTEGQAKTDLNYTFAEIKQISNYIAGKTTFSKQLMYSLNWLMTTLPKILIRDFYKKENDYFYIKMAQAATGVNTFSPTSTVDAEEMIQMIANQKQANFDASYLLVDWRQWARIMLTKPQDYSIPGGVIIDPATGFTRFAGTPMVAASWAQSDHVLVYDRSQVERVETESLNVTFSYENNDNFEKNMVTAKVECFEELNILRPDGIIYRDFGNS
jgi:hypothetical protein